MSAATQVEVCIKQIFDPFYQSQYYLTFFNLKMPAI